MQSLHTQRRRSRRNNPTVKTVAVILCVACFFVLPTFAATDTTNGSLGSFQDSLHSIISFLSRWWVVVAMLAGKLMTNDRVYGSVMHMDVYLWKIWNVMKNFANFGLVAIVIWSVIQSLIGKGGVKVKDIIVKTLVAGVLIQASWFIVWALVDLSTVAVTAISSLPANFIQWNVDWKNTIQEGMDGTMKGQKMVVDLSSNSTDLVQITDVPSTSDGIDAMLPGPTSVSWPLIFLGMSAFKFQDYLKGNSSDSTQSLVMNFSLKTLILFFYSLGLLLIFVANLVRVVFLWLFIIGAPLLILLYFFKKESSDSWTGLMSYLNIQTMLKLVFKPVMLIATMSFILIFIVALQNIMQWSELASINGVSITTTTTSSTLAVQDLSSVKVNNDIFGNLWSASKSIFANLIIFILAIFLIWELVKQSLTGSGPVWAVMKPITWWLQWLAKSTPLIGGFSWWSATGTFRWLGDKTRAGIGINKEWQFQKNTDEYKDRLDTFFNTRKSRWHEQYEALKHAVQKHENFFSTARELGKGRGGVTLNDPQIKSLLIESLIDQKRRSTTDGTEYTASTDFDAFFGGKEWTDSDITRKRRQELHDLLWWNANDEKVETREYPGRVIPYKDLISNIYYKNAE